jgi:peptidoglycan/xylan/chitin deacetylase (PgdA/CDA1 family)
MLWHKVERRLARYSTRQTTSITLDRGVVCFTFDDVQRSACTEGASMLEKHGAYGTFYVCGQFTGQRNYHTHADLRRLANSGHELGSHGFGHLSYQTITEAEILHDLRQNEAFLREFGYGVAENFAYPYGHVGRRAKRIVSPIFASSRGIHPGIHFRTIDLALMRAFPLYSGIWSEKRLAALLEKNASSCGLTIFLSHGVARNPGPFDCSSELLETAVRLAIMTGNTVMRVRDAIQNACRRDDPTKSKRCNDV